MGNRTYNGHTNSSNQWPMVDEAGCQWVVVPGTDVQLQIQKGWPLAILRAFAADFNAYIEPLRNADSACWTAGNSVDTSNHLSGTAMDLNWNSHPFKVTDAGFDAAKRARVYELLNWYEGTMFWGNDWSSPKDAMHFQLSSLANGGPINTLNNPAIADFILRKIRPDGFSTFKRGDTPNLPAQSPALILQKATDLSLARCEEILPAVASGLIGSGCTTPDHIAMWLAQVGHESVSFLYTEEIAKNGRYAPYIGRTWIQITWDYNYRAFGKWCADRGLVPDSEFFVRDWFSLANLKWAGLGAAWYWTVSRPQINAMCDRRDLNGVTYAINGGYNGLSDRQTRYNKALTVGAELLQLIGTTTPVLDEWEALMADDTLYPSLSPYRTDDKPVVTLRELVRQNNAMLHGMLVEFSALRGNAGAIGTVAALAQGQGPGASDPFKVEDAKNVIRIVQAALAAQTGAPK